VSLIAVACVLVNACNLLRSAIVSATAGVETYVYNVAVTIAALLDLEVIDFVDAMVSLD
jgi:hypothetical protein